MLHRYASVWLLSVFLSVCLSACLRLSACLCLFSVAVCLYLCLSVCFCMFRSACLSIFVFLSVFYVCLFLSCSCLSSGKFISVFLSTIISVVFCVCLCLCHCLCIGPCLRLSLSCLFLFVPCSSNTCEQKTAFVTNPLWLPLITSLPILLLHALFSFPPCPVLFSSSSSPLPCCVPQDFRLLVVFCVPATLSVFCLSITHSETLSCHSVNLSFHPLADNLRKPCLSFVRAVTKLVTQCFCKQVIKSFSVKGGKKVTYSR